MFMSGEKINFDIVIHFVGYSTLTINSAHLISIGQLVSQISDDQSLGQSNNFTIEVAETIDLSSLSLQNIKYIEVFGKWKVINFLHKDGKYIFTCQGFLQSLADCSYTPAMPGDAHQYFLSALESMLQLNGADFFSADSYSFLNSQYRGQKLCDQQKVREYIFTSDETDLSFNFNGIVHYLDTITGLYENDCTITLQWHPCFRATGNTLQNKYSQNHDPYWFIKADAVAPVHSTIGGSGYTQWRLCEQNIELGERAWCITDDIQNIYRYGATYVTNHYLTQNEYLSAYKDPEFLTSYSFNLAGIENQYTAQCSANLTTFFNPTPIDLTYHSTYSSQTFHGKIYSIKDSVYTSQTLAQGLTLCNYLAIESQGGISIVSKDNVFNNSAKLQLNSGNINDFRETENIFYVYDGARTDIKYLAAADGSEKTYNFLPENCYYPQKNETTLLNGTLDVKNFAAYNQNTNKWNINAWNNNYSRLGAITNYYISDVAERWRGYDYYCWEHDYNSYFIDGDNQLLEISDISFLYGVDDDYDDLFNVPSYYVNKNNEYADFTVPIAHPSSYASLHYFSTLDIVANKKPRFLGNNQDIIDVSGVRFGVNNVFDVGPHLVYECKANLETMDLVAGDKVTIKNIRNFGDYNKEYQGFIIHRSTDLLHGSVSLQFIILDDYIGKAGFSEKSHFETSQWWYAVRDYEDRWTESHSTLTHNCEKISIIFKNIQSNFEREFFYSAADWQVIEGYNRLIPGTELQNLIFDGNLTGSGFLIQEDPTYGGQLVLSSQSMPDLTNKQITVKWTA